MNLFAGLKLRPWMLVLLMGMLFLLHVSQWVARPPDTDPVNFQMALNGYSIADDRPHPAGYPAFVGAAVAFSKVVGKAHAYQAVNLLLATLSCVGLFLIARRMLGWHQAWAAALLFASHPLLWAATVISECYVSDCFMATSLVLAAMHVGAHRGRWLALLALVFLLSLFRAVSVALLTPLMVCVLVLSTAPEQRLRASVLGMLTALVGVVGGYALTVHLGGGMEVYARAADRVMGASFRSYSVLGGAPIQDHLKGMGTCLAWFATLSGLLCLPLFVLGSALQGQWLRPAWPARHITWPLVAWTVPILGFYLVIYYLKPTYHLIYLPALVLLPLAALQSLHPKAVLAAALLMSLGQVTFFLAGPQHLPAPLYRLTQTYFKQRTQDIESLEAALREASKGTKPQIAWAIGYQTLPLYVSRTLANGQVILVSFKNGTEPRHQYWWDTWHGASLKPQRPDIQHKLAEQLAQATCLIVVIAGPNQAPRVISRSMASMPTDRLAIEQLALQDIEHPERSATPCVRSPTDGMLADTGSPVRMAESDRP